MYRKRVDIREIANCTLCFEPMLYIFDHKLRPYCYECTEYMKKRAMEDGEDDHDSP